MSLENELKELVIKDLGMHDVTMEEYLTGKEIPHGLYNYMAMHANASLTEPIDRVAASEQVKILQQIATRGGGGY